MGPTGQIRSTTCLSAIGGRTKKRIPVYASRLYSMPLDELRVEAQRYKDEGYTAMKLRFSWGPVDGAEGMQRNVRFPVRTVRRGLSEMASM